MLPHETATEGLRGVRRRRLGSVTVPAKKGVMRLAAAKKLARNDR